MNNVGHLKMVLKTITLCMKIFNPSPGRSGQETYSLCCFKDSTTVGETAFIFFFWSGLIFLCFGLTVLNTYNFVKRKKKIMRYHTY